MPAMTSIPQPKSPSPVLGEMSRAQLERAFLDTRAEYAVTKKVVAVLAERLLKETGAIALSITDEALMRCADLDARRNEARKAVIIKVSR